MPTFKRPATANESMTHPDALQRGSFICKKEQIVMVAGMTRPRKRFGGGQGRRLRAGKYDTSYGLHGRLSPPMKLVMREAHESYIIAIRCHESGRLKHLLRSHYLVVSFAFGGGWESLSQQSGKTSMN
jgi:hypothetical protein